MINNSLCEGNFADGKKNPRMSRKSKRKWPNLVYISMKIWPSWTWSWKFTPFSVNSQESLFSISVHKYAMISQKVQKKCALGLIKVSCTEKKSLLIWTLNMINSFLRKYLHTFHLFRSTFFFFWLQPVACGILILQPRTEPVLLVLGAGSLNRWSTREVPRMLL